MPSPPLAASAVVAGRCGGPPALGWPWVAAGGEGAGVCRAPLFTATCFADAPERSPVPFQHLRGGSPGHAPS